MSAEHQKLLHLFGILWFFAASSVASGSNSTVDPGTKKAYMLAEILLKHPHLSEQIWDIGFTAVLSGLGRDEHFVDKKTKTSFQNMVLDNIPRLLKNINFQDMLHDILLELSTAYKKSNVSNNNAIFNSQTGRISYDAALDFFNHVDVGKLLKKGMIYGKPLIDEFRGNDSTAIISLLYHLIDLAPYIWNDTSALGIKAIMIHELTEGYESLIKDRNISSGMSMKNSTAILLRYTCYLFSVIINKKYIM